MNFIDGFCWDFCWRFDDLFSKDFVVEISTLRLSFPIGLRSRTMWDVHHYPQQYGGLYDDFIWVLLHCIHILCHVYLCFQFHLYIIWPVACSYIFHARVDIEVNIMCIWYRAPYSWACWRSDIGRLPTFILLWSCFVQVRSLLLAEVISDGVRAVTLGWFGIALELLFVGFYSCYLCIFISVRLISISVS